MAEKVKLVTPKVRASFCHLVEPRAPAEGADPQYSMALMLSKTDPEAKKFLISLKQKMNDIAKAKFGTVPKKLKLPVKDGDAEDRPEWEGFWIVNASNRSRPGIVDFTLTEVVDPDLLYSGAVYRASVSPWAWSHAVGGKGISLNLDNVMWCEHGDRFDSRTKAEDDFADFAEEPSEAPDMPSDDEGDEEEMAFG